ncbi:MAG: hypothetical protein LBU74_06615 [Methanobacteriaceae archaeon]|jgi:hypothetical protein|nr:hypothetical protein [Candidatus Methanorudis spinitermitis]
MGIYKDVKNKRDFMGIENPKEYLMAVECSCENNCMITSKEIEKSLKANDPCPQCKEPNIKKFKPLSDQFSLNDIDNDFGKCSCKKRSLDSVMVHVLKAILDLNIDIGKNTLRNGPTPLITPFYTTKNFPFIGENSLVILDDRLEKEHGKYIVENINEVKGVLKGSSHDTVGIKDSNSPAIVYELLSGCDIRCDILKSPLEPIAINKIQRLSYLEFPKSMENKIMKLCSYIKSKHYTGEKVANLKILDGTCGNGSLGIFLLKYGVKKVIFNDIWYPATVTSSINLQSNGFKTDFLSNENNYKNNSENNNFYFHNYNVHNFNKKNEIDDIKTNKINPLNYKIAEGEKFEVYNLAIENLASNLKYNHEKIDICILDCFPNVNTSKFEKIAKSVANDVWII